MPVTEFTLSSESTVWNTVVTHKCISFNVKNLLNFTDMLTMKRFNCRGKKKEEKKTHADYNFTNLWVLLETDDKRSRKAIGQRPPAETPHWF